MQVIYFIFTALESLVDSLKLSKEPSKPPWRDKSTIKWQQITAKST